MRTPLLTVTCAALGVSFLLSTTAIAAVQKDTNTNATSVIARKGADDRIHPEHPRPEPGDDRGGRNLDTTGSNLILARKGADDRIHPEHPRPEPGDDRGGRNLG
jgi:hypothetical protein